MAQESLFSLLNTKTPEEIRQSIGRVDDQSALAAAQLAPGRGQVYNARRAGGHLRRAFSGPTAAEERATKLQVVNQEIQEMQQNNEIDPTNAVDVFDAYAKKLGEAGLSAEAATFAERSEAMKIARGELEADKIKAAGETNKPMSTMGKLMRDRDRAQALGRTGDAAKLQERINKIARDQESATNILKGVLLKEKVRINNLNKRRLKNGLEPIPFVPGAFEPESLTIIDTLSRIQGEKKFLTDIFRQFDLPEDFQKGNKGIVKDDDGFSIEEQ